MRVQEVMTSPAIGVIPSSNIAEAAKLMVEHRISGLPVVDASRHVLGMITEGDLLRRSELGTEAKRPDWQSLFASSGKLADEYAHSHGRKVEEVMSPNAITIAAAAALGEAVELMLKHRVKRLPVVSKQGEMVGIVSRSDIVKALLAALPAEVPSGTDAQINDAIIAELERQQWAGMDSVRIAVNDGFVDLYGTIFDDRQRNALKVVAENTPGVKRVIDHLAWVEPMSGQLVLLPDEEAPDQGADGTKAA